MQIGPYEVHTLDAGYFRLDGGAMFGHVPKPLWGRRHESDDHNRVPLATRLLYVEGVGRRILVDTGMGDKWDEDMTERFGLKLADGGLQGALERVGAGLELITDVILTHLHFDHAGGVTTRNDSGQIVPTFPNAMVHLQRRNLEWARKPNPKERASYLEENFAVLEEEDRFVLHDGPRDVLPGISVIVSDGHTEGLQVVRVSGDDQAIYYPADLIPTASHVHLPWTMGYDNHALRVVEEKRTLLESAAAGGHWIVYIHDPLVAASQVEWTGTKFQPIEERGTL